VVGSTATGDLAAAQIDDQIIEDEAFLARSDFAWIVCGLRAGLLARQPHAAQQRLHPCHQLAHTEGLGEVVIGPNLKPHDCIHFIGAGGQHENRDAGFLPEDSANLEAIQDGQHDVKHHQVGMLAAGNVQRLSAVHRHSHFVPLLEQIVFQRVNQRRFVLYDKYFLAHPVVFPGCKQQKPHVIQRPMRACRSCANAAQPAP